jgi:hypothetical protein
MTSYLSATRHPWVCLLFVLPLLVVYEGGVLWLGGSDPTALRNGADVWLRWGLERYGLNQLWVAPVIVVGILAVRSWAGWASRPSEPLATCFGMLIESVAFAALLWAAARNFEPLMREWGVPTASVASVTVKTPAAAQVVTYIGAGIYEEVLFRLGLFSVGVFLLRAVLFPKPLAVLLSGVGAALVFAGAHHIGPNGEEMVPAKFLFRVAAGLAFTVLYVARGFGVAVGSHAAYDVLVGTAVG